MNNGRDCKHGQLARSCEICGLEAEIDALRTRLAEVERDAMRYQWLKDQPALDLKSDGSTWTNAEGKFVASHRLCAGHTAYSPYTTLDEIIDAAMKEQA